MTTRLSAASATTPTAASFRPTVPTAAPVKASIVPTNTVTTKDGVTVRARIDPALTVEDVVRQLCVNLRIPDPPALFALRDDMDELVTNENMRKKIQGKAALK
jgi:engulfment/cell motility protein 1